MHSNIEFIQIVIYRNHPERPARISSIYEKLVDYSVSSRCLRLDARDATREELLWLHDADYLDQMETTAEMKQPALNQLERKYGSIFMCPETQQAALLSAGSALQVVESIMSGESRSGLGVRLFFFFGLIFCTIYL